MPTLCVEESHRRRLAYRNERRLYKDTCDLTGKSMISLYSPNKNFKVYSQEAWWSDDWDSRSYGRNYDFNKPFFEQFQALKREVPRLSLMNMKAENSEFCNVTTSNKNCYLVFGGDYNEDCIYSVFCFHSKNCSDLYWVNRAELCYECVDCDDIYNCRFCAHTYNSRDSDFLFDCRGCSDCFGCVGLRNKRYCFFNKQYSKEEYQTKVADYDLRFHENLKRAEEDFLRFKIEKPNRANFIISCENCSGNNLINCKNCFDCFDVDGSAEDMRSIILAGWNVQNLLRTDHSGHGTHDIYEVQSAASSVNSYFGTYVWNSYDTFYCDMVVNNSHDLFGCCNMKKSAYCILNKQYSKEEYFDLKARIIEHMKSTGEWGEFFPIRNSPFAYNETIANDYLPLTKDVALKAGLQWQDEELKKMGSGDKVPDSIDEVGEDIYGKTFVCAETGRPYKVNETEIKLYKRLSVPVPILAPETRNVARFNSRNPWRSWQRKCAKCGMSVNSSFAPNRPEVVYCEKCYMAEVY